MVATLLSCLAVSGCATGIHQGHFDSVVDPTTTSSVPATGNPVDREKLSDETTIRNAVSSANLENLGQNALSWANLDTGSRGAVSDITEFREGEIRCRKFTASRESYEGVALYRGSICLLANGSWKTLEFTAL